MKKAIYSGAAVAGVLLCGSLQAQATYKKSIPDSLAKAAKVS